MKITPARSTHCTMLEANDTTGTRADLILIGAYPYACCTACPHSCAATAAAATLLLLSGVAVAGCTIASELSVDTATLQEEVKKQFEAWKASLLNILATCDDENSIRVEHEE